MLSVLQQGGVTTRSSHEAGEEAEHGKPAIDEVDKVRIMGLHAEGRQD